MPDPTAVLGAATIVVAAPSFWAAMLPGLPAFTATILSAAIGGLIALRAIYHNRAIARLRATLDLIERTESQAYYQELSTTFRDFRSFGSVETVLSPKNNSDRETRTKILFFLNHYELIAVGFRNAVLEKTFYAEFMRGTVVRDWRAARPLVHGMRNSQSNPTPQKMFEHFEALALEWEWEIGHEQRLREQGRSEAEIAKITAWFRADPRRRFRARRLGPP